jgi:uncharacterized membrane protein YhaH (DUF805 family)
MLKVPHCSFYTSLNGRVGRKEYWLKFAVPFFAIGLVVVVTSPPLLFSKFVMGYWVLSLWPAIAAGAKRCHDRGRSGWFQLILLIPIVGPIWLAWELLFLSGTNGVNRFGPDPKQEDVAGADTI